MRHSFIKCFGLLCLGIILVACEDSYIVNESFESDPAAKSTLGRNNVIVAKPFKADLFTDLAGLTEDPSCEGGNPNDPFFLNTQVGEGESTQLGRFTVHITFCVDVTDLSDGVLDPGESLPYKNGVGTMTAANGDELMFTISGEVLPSDKPGFDFEFFDTFVFSGGTGRFTNASGSGETSSFVDFTSVPSRTQHDWRGVLRLVPGR